MSGGVILRSWRPEYFRVWAIASLSLAAQPLPKTTDFPAHGKLPGIEIGARFLPNGLPSDAAVRAGKDFLVVDVGIFPETRGGVSVSKSQFTLSVDGKTMLAARSPLANSSNGPAVVARDSLSHDSSSHGGSVELGGPPITGHPGGKELESMPRRPISLDPQPDAGQSAARAGKVALPEGPTNKPVSGYLFFRFEGNPKAIRSLDLVYDGGGRAKTRIPILSSSVKPLSFASNRISSVRTNTIQEPAIGKIMTA